MLNIKNNKIIITGCVDCPCCIMNDMSSGYSCRMKASDDNYIKENIKKFIPITPKWCPVKENTISIKYKK